MRVRSKALYQYLLESGVLNGTAEEIDCAKRAYRKQYKKQWKRNKRPRKEIRIEFTLKQFQAIKRKAREYDLPHTTFARQVMLAAVAPDAYFIPHLEKLQKILQLVSMATIDSTRQTIITGQLTNWLLEAESELLHYIQRTY